MPGRLTETVERVMNPPPVTPSPVVTVGGRRVRTDKTQAEKAKLVLQDIAHLMDEHCGTPELRPLYRSLKWLEQQVRAGNVPL